jgi:hypothetical protein
MDQACGGDHVTARPGDVLPPLYQGWMDELLPTPLQFETRADCASCPMASEPLRPGLEVAFDAHARCCTFIPNLPNFLVGRIHSGAPDDGRESLRERVRDEALVTPLGVELSRRQYDAYDELCDADQFGRGTGFVCPHLGDDGGCVIWRNRNSVCSTWFCRHVKGKLGATFWHRQRDLLIATELELARWCVAQLELGAVATGLLLGSRPERGHTALTSGECGAEGAPLWGPVEDRKEEYFLRCAELVEALDWTEIERICAEQGRPLDVPIADLLSAQRRMHSEDLPEHIKVCRFKAMRGPDGTAVHGSSRYDTVELTNEIPFHVLMVMPVLAETYPVASFVAQLQARTGVALRDEQIRWLLHVGILRPMDAPEV